MLQWHAPPLWEVPALPQPRRRTPSALFSWPGKATSSRSVSHVCLPGFGLLQVFDLHSSIWISEISHVCPPQPKGCWPASQPDSQPAILCDKNLDIGHCAQTFQPVFDICHAYGHPFLLSFYTTVSDLDYGWRTQGRQKIKPLDFTFLHTFQLIKMGFSIVKKQYMLNILILIIFFF